MQCIASDSDQICGRDAVMFIPVALCDYHRVQVALAIVPEVLNRHLVDTARPIKADQLVTGPHDKVVYLIRIGNRVKIGCTTNLRTRMSSLALDQSGLLLVLDGGSDLERALHEHFAAYRDGGNEWFELAPEIEHYVEGRRALPPRKLKPVNRERLSRTPTVSSVTDAEQIDLVTDLDRVIGDEPRLRTQEALRRLAALNPDVYGKWMFSDLTRVLAAAGAEPHSYNGRRVVDRRKLLAALARFRNEQRAS